MTLPPLVERELRTGARRTPLFWLRGLLALILGAQAYDLLNRHTISAPPPPVVMAPMTGLVPAVTSINGSLLLQDMAMLLFVAVLLMSILSADTISRERREGTLGLLLLTDLTPFQIVYGKMISCGLNSFLILLGGLPVLILPVLLGGVTGLEAAITGLGLLNTLFVSLAAGLWMSALCTDRWYAVGTTLGLVAALTFGSELFFGTWFGPAGIYFARLVGLGGWMTIAQMPPLYALLFIPWFVIINVVGWVILYCAGRTLLRNWQDKPQRQVREVEAPVQEWPPYVAEGAVVTEASAGRISWLTDPRPWDASPVGWRVGRMGSIEGFMWAAIALNFIGQFCALGSGSGRSGSAESWGLVSFGGLVVSIFSGGLLAWAGARFFLDAKRQQDLELLLTTTVGSRSVLSGQWQVLRKALKFPLSVVLLVALPSGISLISTSGAGSNREFWSSFPTFMVPVNLAVEVVALCWMGMYAGLRSQHLPAAILRTVALVQLIPLALAAAAIVTWTFMDERGTYLAASHGRMPIIAPILVFLLVKNFAFIFWARYRLRSLLRLKRSAAQRTASVTTLIPQPA